MTPEELALYKKCTAKYRKRKPISASSYNEEHEYDNDTNEQHEYDV